MKSALDFIPETPEEREQRLSREKNWMEADAKLHATIFQLADNLVAKKTIHQLNKQWHRLRMGIYMLRRAYATINK